MNETEERVVDILTSFPPGDRPWGEPINAVMRAMKWDSSKTKAYVEYLIHRNHVVLKNDEPNAAADRFGKLQSWWDSSESR